MKELISKSSFVNLFCSTSSPLDSRGQHEHNDGDRGHAHSEEELASAEGPKVPVNFHSPNEWTHKGKTFLLLFLVLSSENLNLRIRV